MDDLFLGTTAVCFVFNFCLLCSHRLPVSERNLPVPSQFLNKFLKYVFKDRIKIYRKKTCRFKTWMEFVRQILMKLKTSSNEGFLLKVFSHSLMWLSKHRYKSISYAHKSFRYTVESLLAFSIGRHRNSSNLQVLDTPPPILQLIYRWYKCGWDLPGLIHSRDLCQYSSPHREWDSQRQVCRLGLWQRQLTPPGNLPYWRSRRSEK